jgi:hypothetical protein
MRMWGHFSGRKAVRPLSITGIVFAAISLLPGAFPAGAATPPPALTPTETASVQSGVQQALAGIGSSLTGVARVQAIDAALQQIAQSDACSIGPAAIAAITADAIADGVAPTTAVDATIRGGIACATTTASTDIAEAVIGAVDAGASAANVAAQALATATNIPLPPAVSGVGLGMAAAELSSTNLAAAQAIGQTVANEAVESIRVAYAEGVTANGGPEEVAALADAFPVATGETGETGQGANNNFGFNQNQGNNTFNGDEAENNNQQANQNQNLPDSKCGQPTCI